MSLVKILGIVGAFLVVGTLIRAVFLVSAKQIDGVEIHLVIEKNGESTTRILGLKLSPDKNKWLSIKRNGEELWAKEKY